MSSWKYMRARVSIVNLEPLFRVLLDAMRRDGMEVVTLHLRVAYAIHHTINSTSFLIFFFLNQTQTFNIEWT